MKKLKVHISLVLVFIITVFFSGCRAPMLSIGNVSTINHETTEVEKIEIIQDGDFEYYYVSRTIGVNNPQTGVYFAGENASPPKPNQDGYIIVGYNGNAFELTLPSTASDGTPIIGIGRWAFSQVPNLSAIVIPDGYQYIFDCAFIGVNTLERIYIGASVEYISSGMIFEQCDKLQQIIVDADNLEYISIDNCLLERNSMHLIAGCSTSVIPDGTLCIESGAFSERQGPQIISIPSSVVEIEGTAFIGCKSTESIYLETPPLVIGQHAFSDCPDATIYCNFNAPLPSWDELWRGDSSAPIGETSVVWTIA